MAFGALSLTRSPQLTISSFDAAAVTGDGAQLRITADQNLSRIEASDVRVEPAIAHTVSSESASATVTFDAPLRYSTKYTVTATGRSEFNGVAAQVVTSFTTPAPDLYYLDRTGVDDDRIIRTDPTGAVRDTVFEAPRITDFVRAGTLIVAITATPDDTSTITLVSTLDGSVEPLRLSAPATVDQLRSSPTSNRIGFRVTSEGAAGVLHLVDLDRGRQAVAVAGPDGARLEVEDWAFVNGGLGLVAGTWDDIVISDVLTRHVQLLAQRAALRGISTDGQTVTARVSAGDQDFQLNGASAQPTPAAAGLTQLLRGRTLEAAGPELHVDGNLLYRAPDGFEITGLTATPNDQFAVVEIAEPGRAGERAAGRTVLVDSVTGDEALDVPGVMLRW